MGLTRRGSNFLSADEAYFAVHVARAAVDDLFREAARQVDESCGFRLEPVRGVLTW